MATRSRSADVAQGGYQLDYVYFRSCRTARRTCPIIQFRRLMGSWYVTPAEHQRIPWSATAPPNNFYTSPDRSGERGNEAIPAGHLSGSKARAFTRPISFQTSSPAAHVRFSCALRAALSTDLLPRCGRSRDAAALALELRTFQHGDHILDRVFKRRAHRIHRQLKTLRTLRRLQPQVRCVVVGGNGPPRAANDKATLRLRAGESKGR